MSFHNLLSPVIPSARFPEHGKKAALYRPTRHGNDTRFEDVLKRAMQSPPPPM